jgi:hypothetical protein
LAGFGGGNCKGTFSFFLYYCDCYLWSANSYLNKIASISKSSPKSLAISSILKSTYGDDLFISSDYSTSILSYCIISYGNTFQAYSTTSRVRDLWNVNNSSINVRL